MGEVCGATTTDVWLVRFDKQQLKIGANQYAGDACVVVGGVVGVKDVRVRVENAFARQQMLRLSRRTVSEIPRQRHTRRRRWRRRRARRTHR